MEDWMKRLMDDVRRIEEQANAFRAAMEASGVNEVFRRAAKEYQHAQRIAEQVKPLKIEDLAKQYGVALPSQDEMRRIAEQFNAVNTAVRPLLEDVHAREKQVFHDVPFDRHPDLTDIVSRARRRDEEIKELKARIARLEQDALNRNMPPEPSPPPPRVNDDDMDDD